MAKPESNRYMTGVIQISDSHLLADPGQCLNDVNTQASLERVLSRVLTLNPDLLVMSGDLSQDGSLASYQRLAKTVAGINCPVYWTLGNHDDRENARHGLVGGNLSADSAVLINGWQIILLDSTAPGLDDGFIGTVDFTHLQRCLTCHPETPAMIVMHHHPIAIGCYMDEIRVINSQKYLGVLKTFPQVRAVLFGHVHQEFVTLRDGVQFLGAPSTCVQFAPRLEKFAIDTSVTPGYRWVELASEGHFTTGVIRI